ncbi:GntR family transcriptional regulator [Brumimicrobium salinarum]|uniref:GntR family transcriptional regulator n=1 Tax=Brumimicrobium salinarum TaxID=2058658 RepID=A0A2I0R0N1_9FLAO|nr:S1-like domain-containing RNA-binding protein [Brumimicrobium salinarum]PKR80133.1 GntR family transcriptional regulator [Brumimicrobium salinarum]
MTYIGEHVNLRIDRFTSVGAYLEDDNGFEVLLPNKYLTDDLELDQEISVYIYNDSEDRPVATTETPKIELDSFAFLIVKEVSNFGAFLDWGLEKDLLVPFKEQTAKMVEGGIYLVRLYRDEQTNRLVGSAKINKFLTDQVEGLNQGDEIDLFIGEITDLGRKVIVNNRYNGLIFKDRLVKPLKTGETTKGYVEFIREDGKIDVSLVPVGLEKFDAFSEMVLAYLKENDGEISVTDKSSPDLIRSELKMSKKSFKKAVGNLYKNKIIKINSDSITLL